MTDRPPAVPSSTPATARRDVSPRLKAALDGMVERGLELQEAAKEAKMTTRGLRLALSRPAVLSYLKRARSQFISEIRASTPRRLKALRDQESNPAAAVRAALALEQIGEEPGAASGRITTPGIVILVGSGANQQTVQASPTTIDVTPRARMPIPHEIEHDPGEAIDVADEQAPASEPALADELEEQPLDEWLRQNAIRIETGTRLAPPNTAGIADLAQNRPQQTRLRYRGARRRVE